jgi:phosphomannomutase
MLPPKKTDECVNARPDPMTFPEHNPPHFHARYGECKVEIAIKTLSVLAGKLPPRAMGLVMEWASRHQDELMADWELACQNAELKRIDPLE